MRSVIDREKQFSCIMYHVWRAMKHPKEIPRTRAFKCYHTARRIFGCHIVRHNSELYLSSSKQSYLRSRSRSWTTLDFEASWWRACSRFSSRLAADISGSTSAWPLPTAYSILRSRDSWRSMVSTAVLSKVLSIVPNDVVAFPVLQCGKGSSLWSKAVDHQPRGQDLWPSLQLNRRQPLVLEDIETYGFWLSQ